MNEPKDSERDNLTSIIRNHVSQLGEHFENVQILCSNVEQGGDSTVSFSVGSGNFHARLNHAREWAVYHEEKERCKARCDFDDDEDDV